MHDEHVLIGHFRSDSLLDGGAPGLALSLQLVDSAGAFGIKALDVLEHCFELAKTIHRISFRVLLPSNGLEVVQPFFPKWRLSDYAILGSFTQ